MTKRNFLITGLIAGLILFTSAAHANWWPFSDDDADAQSKGELTLLNWDDLIPDDFVQPENPFATMSQEKIDKLMDGSEESEAEIARLQDAFNYAPVVDHLDGKRVKIPAYITPLEYNPDQKMNEFLLVPFVGACMHVPPPPANQIVHAKSKNAIEQRDMNEAVWAIGVIRAETIKSNLAESGYQLEVEEVLPYTSQ